MIQDFFPGFTTRIMVRCNTKQSLHNGVVKHKNDQAQIMEERAYCATSDLWSTRRVVTTDWPAIWSTMTYPNYLWRSQQWYQNGWSQDVAITNNEPLLCMPTMWIHLGGNKKALLVMVIWRQTHLAVLLHTPLLSSPLSRVLVYFPLLFVMSPSSDVPSTATNISEKHGGGMFCHNAVNHEQHYTASCPRPNKHN